MPYNLGSTVTVESLAVKPFPPDFEDALAFPLVAALLGRRSRRFSLGATLPDGPLAYASKHPPMPLSELERALVLSAVARTTGWHYLIMRHARYAPNLSNYSASAVGRTFPSAAGFHTSEIFFTDDSGTYFLSTRDAPPPAFDPNAPPEESLERLLQAQRALAPTFLRAALPPCRRALHGGAQYLVRQRAR
jgi:hypothetical protein